MQNRLILMRHARAALADPGITDFARTLADGGAEEAGRTARTLMALGIVPDAVLTSPARRTLQTLEAIMQVWQIAPATTHEQSLYSGGVSAYLDAAEGHSSGTLLIVGHNPMIEQAAFAMMAKNDIPDELRRGFPTAAAAVFETDETGMGRRLTRFIAP
jgi:phosphohistidine phosphatase